MFADSYPMREVEDGFFFEVDGSVRGVERGWGRRFFFLIFFRSIEACRAGAPISFFPSSFSSQPPTPRFFSLFPPPKKKNPPKTPPLQKTKNNPTTVAGGRRRRR